MRSGLFPYVIISHTPLLPYSPHRHHIHQVSISLPSREAAADLGSLGGKSCHFVFSCCLQLLVLSGFGHGLCASPGIHLHAPLWTSGSSPLPESFLYPGSSPLSFLALFFSPRLLIFRNFSTLQNHFPNHFSQPRVSLGMCDQLPNWFFYLMPLY